MLANQWELRADVRPLEQAAARWSDVGQLMAVRAEEIVDAARHALDGWDAAAAESYERHRRQVIANLDQFTTLAGEIAGSLRAASSILTSSQKELDSAWVRVSVVPHEVVGDDRRLFFRPAGDEDRELVRRCEGEAEEIRQRLTSALDGESSRLRSARAQFVLVRTTLTDLSGGVFNSFVGPGLETSGVGIVGPAATSVIGTAESGVSAGLPAIAPISVNMPHLSGLTSTAGLAPIIGSAAGGSAARNGATRRGSGAVPPVGGAMAGGAMRGGSAMRGGPAGGRAGGRAGGGSGRLAAPKLVRTPEDEATRLAREKSAAAKAADKEGKRAAIEAKRAERAARKAERRTGKDDKSAREGDETPDEAATGGAATDASAEPNPARLTVVEIAPGAQPSSERS